MAQPADTHDSFDSIGNREDLEDIIYNISPTATPFMSNIGRTDADNTLHEWQTDSLAAVTANARIEGDDATNTAIVPTVRVGNRTQISDKVIQISGSVEEVDRAGRKSEMAFELAKKAKELKRDMENALIGVNNARVIGNSTTARELGSVESWITTDSFGATGASPTGDGTDARTDGTQRVFTEALLTGVLEDLYTNGGEPNVLMVGAFNKGKVSGFKGNADEVKHNNVDKTVINAVDVYIGDFDTLNVVPNRFSRSRTAYVLQTDMWSVGFLRSFRQWDLAKTGDTDRKQLLVEYTLIAKNEQSSGLIADLTTS